MVDWVGRFFESKVGLLGLSDQFLGGHLNDRVLKGGHKPDR